MVQKWQKVKKEVEEEERNRDEREAEIRRKLQELQEELGWRENYCKHSEDFDSFWLIFIQKKLS